MLSFPLIRMASLIVLLAGCGSISHAELVPQPVLGTPAQFVTLDGDTEPAGMTCRSPLRDRNGVVTLTLVRSGRDRERITIGWGDYAVSPAGSYGLRPNQLLRVECGSGQPAGVVPR